MHNDIGNHIFGKIGQVANNIYASKHICICCSLKHNQFKIKPMCMEEVLNSLTWTTEKSTGPPHHFLFLKKGLINKKKKRRERKKTTNKSKFKITMNV